MNNQKYKDARYKIISTIPLLEAMKQSPKYTEKLVYFDEIVKIPTVDFDHMLKIFKKIESSETEFTIKNPTSVIPPELVFTNWIFNEIQVDLNNL